MRSRKRRLNLFGYRDATLALLRFRFDNLNPEPTAGTGLADGVNDVPPVNGGTDRTFDSLANGTVDEPPVNQPRAPDSPQPSQVRAPTDPNQRVGATPPAAPAAEGWQSIREAAQAQGFQFDHTVTDDRTALNFLLRQAGAARSSDIYAQLGRQLAPQAQGIQAYLAQQTQPQQSTPKPAWEAPEFDPRWVELVELNQQTGLYVAKPGVGHDVAAKVNAYAEWKQGYDRDPAKVLNGMVEARARSIAQETFREQFAAQQREQTIGELVHENSAWLYQVDQGGQRTRDYQGNFIPTPVGAAYLTQLQAVRQMGVSDPRQQDALAKQLVRGQYAQARVVKSWH